MARYDDEAAVIGSILIEPKCIAEVDAAGLCAEDFSDDNMRLAFQVIEDFRQAGQPFDDLVIVANEMAKRKPGDFVPVIHSALAATATALNAGAYCRMVKDNAKRQAFINTLSEASFSAAYGDWKAVADSVRVFVQDVGGSDADVISNADLSAQFLDYFDRAKEDPDSAYCRTGFSDLDDQLGGGMFRSEVYIIGARPGMGKTTLGINIAQNIVNRGGAVLFVSLEMSAPQIQAKRISLETSVRYTHIMSGRVNADEERQVYDWVSMNKAAPFYLTTKPLTVGEIGRKARQIGGLSCIIVDYLGLVSCGEESRQKPRYEQMTEISAGLKATAKALNIPILALCQLNRESTSRQDKRPTMSDLRDSGAIEQDAGAIILLHRPDYYAIKESGEAPELEEIELNVAKNRHAEPGLVRMWWHGNIGRISMPEKGRAIDVPPDMVTEEGELPF